MKFAPPNPAAVAAARAAVRRLAAKLAPRVVPLAAKAADLAVAGLAADPAAARKLSNRRKAAIAAGVVAVALLDALFGSRSLGYFPADQLFDRLSAVLDALSVGCLAAVYAAVLICRA